MEDAGSKRNVEASPGNKIETRALAVHGPAVLDHERTAVDVVDPPGAA